MISEPETKAQSPLGAAVYAGLRAMDACRLRYGPATAEMIGVAREWTRQLRAKGWTDSDAEKARRTFDWFCANDQTFPALSAWMSRAGILQRHEAEESRPVDRQRTPEQIAAAKAAVAEMQRILRRSVVQLPYDPSERIGGAA